MEFVERIPIDVLFEIGVMLGRYDLYRTFAKLVPKLQSDSYSKRARERLTTYRKLTRQPRAYGYDKLDEVVHEWLLDGMLHRENDMPARIKRSRDDDRLVSEEWFTQGNLHRDVDEHSDLKPAIVRYDSKETYFYRHGAYHYMYIHLDGSTMHRNDLYRTGADDSGHCIYTARK